MPLRLHLAPSHVALDFAQCAPTALSKVIDCRAMLLSMTGARCQMCIEVRGDIKLEALPQGLG